MTGVQTVAVKPAHGGAGTNQAAASKLAVHPQVEKEPAHLGFTELGWILLMMVRQLANNTAVGFLSVGCEVFELDMLKKTLETWVVSHMGDRVLQSWSPVSLLRMLGCDLA